MTHELYTGRKEPSRLVLKWKYGNRFTYPPVQEAEDPV